MLDVRRSIHHIGYQPERFHKDGVERGFAVTSDFPNPKVWFWFYSREGVGGVVPRVDTRTVALADLRGLQRRGQQRNSHVD